MENKILCFRFGAGIKCRYCQSKNCIKNGNLGGELDLRNGNLYAGAYAATAEYEATISLHSPNGRWGVISVTHGASIESIGAQGGFKVNYNRSNNSYTVGASGKIALELGLIFDGQITFPNPF